MGCRAKRTIVGRTRSRTLAQPRSAVRVSLLASVFLSVPPTGADACREEADVRWMLCTAMALGTGVVGPATSAALGQTARVTEEVRTLPTYPFSDPNRVPILSSDARLYPYHSFEGYAHEPAPKEWTVVRLENEHIEVFVLPEVGGKVWGAVVKETGHEFVYRNEVMKFRNIALRGPWTSGGIEFNFGVIGHTPATASPVDYLARENPDGSASVIVGTMDLPSRTAWRVEVRLPADAAYFETRALWHNPTPLEQPYYNWMTGAAFAQDDLELTVPGDAYLEHPGGLRSWPFDAEGRHLPTYSENDFGPNKSYHVVGAYDDFFGGYYRDDDYGFGHWSRYEEMPGQKIWLWALSRQGGIWEDLLTDTDGQYMEFQAGRLLVQYSPTGEVNPISQVGFEPGATDRWTERWFPVEGLGGLTEASGEGAMFVDREGSTATVRLHPFGSAVGTLRATVDGRLVLEAPFTLGALERFERSFEAAEGARLVVEVPELELSYDSSPDATALDRPFETDPGALPTIPRATRLVTAARELVQGRELAGARATFEEALALEPWNREALLGLSDLEYRRGRPAAGLAHARRLLQLDAYDPAANFAAGNLYRAAGRDVDATEAFGWAARSMAYRSAAYVQLAELALQAGDVTGAGRYATLATDYDRFNLSALEVGALAARHAGQRTVADSVRALVLEIDPLHHFVAAERFLDGGDPAMGAAFLDGLRSEFPDQEVLELALAYSRRGAEDDAVELLRLSEARFSNPMLGAWRAWLLDDPDALPDASDPAFVFPYRTESIAVLQWAAGASDEWSWRYLLGLALWSRDRSEEGLRELSGLGDRPDFAPFYVARASLANPGPTAEADLRRAVALDQADRLLRIHLVQYLQARGRWDDALTATAAARADFPTDFNLDLLHVGSLVELGGADEAIAILADIRVLPSEHSGTSHTLHVQAHLTAALDALDGGDRRSGAEHARAALEWPERLGLGRPYQPEERLARYVLGVAASEDTALEAVVAASDAGVSDRLDLLGIAARVRLGQNPMLEPSTAEAATPASAFARGLVAAGRSGEGLAEAAGRLGAESAELFADVEGRLLLRALTIGF